MIDFDYELEKVRIPIAIIERFYKNYKSKIYTKKIVSCISLLRQRLPDDLVYKIITLNKNDEFASQIEEFYEKYKEDIDIIVGYFQFGKDKLNFVIDKYIVCNYDAVDTILHILS